MNMQIQTTGELIEACLVGNDNEKGKSMTKPELYIEENDSYSPTRYFIRKRTDSDWFGNIIDFAETESEAKAMLRSLELSQTDSEYDKELSDYEGFSV